MSAALEPALLAALDPVLRPGTLVVLDFDGTLAPIQRQPAAARPSRRTLAAVARLARRFPVAILTGRAAADVLERLHGAPVRWVVGSHGAEWPGEARAHRAWRRRIASWAATLGPRLEALAGAELEVKPLALAVHYRRSARPAQAERVILAMARDLQGASITRGKRVVNLTPAGAGNKGTALRRLARESGASRVIFIGDDVTDEAAFAARLEVPLLGIRVGRSRTTAAHHCLPRRSAVDDLLERISAGRRARRRPPVKAPLGATGVAAIRVGRRPAGRATTSRRGRNSEDAPHRVARSGHRRPAGHGPRAPRL